MKGTPAVVVIAATGFTGRLIVRELRSRGVSRIRIVGRSPAKVRLLSDEVGGVEPRVADVRDPAALRAGLDQGDVVVNCAGPFSRLGEPVVAAAVGVGAHYLDTTGEQEFIRRTVDHWEGPARERGITIVNAMAFEYALGSCAATLLADSLGKPLRSLDVCYSWRVGRSGSSRGTRRSVLDVLTRPAVVFRDGAWRPDRIASRWMRFQLPEDFSGPAFNFPSGEIITLPRHIEVENVSGWLVSGGAGAHVLRYMAPILPGVARALRPVLESLLARGPAGPDEASRERSRFGIQVEAVALDGEVRRIWVEGRDPYGLTAAIAASGAIRLLSQEAGASREPGAAASPAISGVLDPAQLIPPGELLDSLRPRGLRVGWESE